MSTDVYGYDLAESVTGKVLKVFYGQDRAALAVGNYEIADGTANTPAVRFSSDTSTGIYRAAAGSLAISSSGSVKFRVTSTGATLTGLLAGTAVTQTTTDDTTGRLLKVGDYGIGGTAPLVGSIASIAATTPPGVYGYATASGSSGGPTGVTTGTLVWARATASGNESQMLFVTASSSDTYPAGTLIGRTRIASSWTDWRGLSSPVYTTGTVSSGETYRLLKDPNGIMTLTVNNYVTSAGSVPTISFPTAFLSAPVVTATSVSTSTPRFVGATATTTTFSAVAFNTSGAQVSAAVDLVMIGRYA
jgi:hypothetical protein